MLYNVPKESLNARLRGGLSRTPNHMNEVVDTLYLKIQTELRLSIIFRLHPRMTDGIICVVCNINLNIFCIAQMQYNTPLAFYFFMISGKQLSCLHK